MTAAAFVWEETVNYLYILSLELVGLAHYIYTCVCVNMYKALTPKSSLTLNLLHEFLYSRIYCCFFFFFVKQLNLNFEPVRPHTLAHTCTPLSRPRNRRVSKINLATPACHTCTAHHAPRTTQWHTFVAHSHACRQHAAANAAAARAQGAMPLSHVELICYKILFAQSKFDFCCMCNLSCHYTHSQAPYNPHTLSVMRLFFAFLSFWFREFCEFCEFFIFTLVVVVHFSWYFLSHLACEDFPIFSVFALAIWHPLCFASNS